ncbi:MAG: dihydroorotase [Xanthomonadales bacterium]|nr:dihydroorotase [Xanthomonadales bacterium]
MTDRLILTRPDDWHLHLRDGDLLAATVAPTAAVFGRAIVMPNLLPPVTTTAQAQAYRARILAAAPAGSGFEPLMTLYLTEATTAAEIATARASGIVHGAKLYPAGATTNSQSGVADVRRIWPLLAAMQEADLPLLVHGEVTDAQVDVFDREAVFIERHLAPIVEAFPALRVVFEHVTTADAVAFVQQARPGVAATVTPQHLLMNRNDLFAGGLRPHHWCLPVLKRRRHQEALRTAVASGDPRFFLGSDSAPHARRDKESACGCAGCYSAPAALPLYAQVFEELGCLDRLEAFASHHGADFYGLPRNTGRIVLERSGWTVPDELPFGAGGIVPYWAGRPLQWRVADTAALASAD